MKNKKIKKLKSAKIEANDINDAMHIDALLSRILGPEGYAYKRSKHNDFFVFVYWVTPKEADIIETLLGLNEVNVDWDKELEMLLDEQEGDK